MTEEKQEKSYYVVIPTHLFDDDRLPWKIKRLYGLIVSLCKKEGFCWAENSFLAEEIKTSTRTIQRYLKKLVEMDMISCPVDDNYKRKIWLNKLGKTMGKTSERGDNPVIGGYDKDKNKRVAGVRQDKGESVAHISKDNNNVIIKDFNYKTEKQKLLKKMEMTDPLTRTEIQEKSARIIRSNK